MTAAKHAAIRVAALKLLHDKVKAADTEARAEALDQMETGDRRAATYADTRFAAVTKTAGRTNPRITDPDKFAAWVTEHYPSEVEHKPVVRPAFIAAVLTASRNAGEPCAPDGTLDVPGVVVAAGEPYLSVKLTADAEEVVARMVADGYLTAAGELRQLEGEAQP